MWRLLNSIPAGVASGLPLASAFHTVAARFFP